MTPAEIVSKSYSEAVPASEYATLAPTDLQAIIVMLKNEAVAKSIQIQKNSYLRNHNVVDAKKASRLIKLQQDARETVAKNIETIIEVLADKEPAQIPD